MAQFVKVAQLGQLPSGQALKVEVAGQEIALFNLAGEVFATSDRCTHMQASLSEGQIKGDQIVCPWHGLCFEIRTGKALGTRPWPSLRTYRVRVSGDDIELEIEE